MGDFKILAFENLEFKIWADFKTLVDFKIMAVFEILAFQNLDFKFLADFKY